MKLLLRWLASAVALIAVSYLLPSITVASFGTAMWAALAIGLINATIGEVVKLVTLPIRFLTLGLFTLVINAGLFWLATEVVDGFDVDGFWAALIGSLAYGLLASIVQGLVGAKKK